jgi:uncharacterized membrane protein YraQ (UPF0718 family)
MASPLCTYGTIPVLLQLYRSGISIAPLVTFLITSSLMNPQLFIFTWGGISPEMALVRTACILIFGILFGLAVYRVPLKWIINKNMSLENKENIIKHRDKKSFIWKTFLLNTWESLQFTLFYLLIGILAGSAVEVLVPADWIAGFFKPGEWYSVLAAALLGVPLYACGGGVIPLIRSLMLEGMSKGAALAFFLVGPATRVTPLIALASILRPLFIIIYLIILVVFSVAAGLIYR